MYELIKITGPVARFILLILFIFSTISWGIIAYKYFFIKKYQTAIKEFLKQYYECDNLNSMFDLAKCSPSGGLSGILISCCQEMRKFIKNNNEFKLEFENVYRAIEKAHNSEIYNLKKHIHFLATTASACPFIGLFGTVWGIMNSFQSINISGQANISVIAPGISGALITTVFGLGAAIPAVIFYNYFCGKIKRINSEIESFKADLLNFIERG